LEVSSVLLALKPRLKSAVSNSQSHRCR